MSERVATAKWIERDRSMALWMHGASSRAWVVGLLQPISRVGNGALWYLIVVTLPWTEGSSGSSAATRMFCVGGVNILIYKIVKKWVARPRPFRTCANIKECVPSLDEFSFPSGHTLHSVACSVVLTAYYPTLGWVVWPSTLLVASSRVVLGLHYPGDAVMGALIGGVTSVLSFNLL